MPIRIMLSAGSSRVVLSVLYPDGAFQMKREASAIDLATTLTFNLQTFAKRWSQGFSHPADGVRLSRLLAM